MRTTLLLSRASDDNERALFKHLRSKINYFAAQNSRENLEGNKSTFKSDFRKVCAAQMTEEISKILFVMKSWLQDIADKRKYSCIIKNSRQNVVTRIKGRALLLDLSRSKKGHLLKPQFECKISWAAWPQCTLNSHLDSVALHKHTQRQLKEMTKKSVHSRDNYQFFRCLVGCILLKRFSQRSRLVICETLVDEITNNVSSR